MTDQPICQACEGTGETGHVRHPGRTCRACGGLGIELEETDDLGDDDPDTYDYETEHRSDQ